MSSYLSQFNYQFIRGGQSPDSPQAGTSSRQLNLEEVRHLEPSDRKWIFLHGLMGYAINWRKIVSGLNKTDVSLIFDQRGHGRSWQPETGYAPEDYAEDVFRISQELGWQKFNLVGHSMGGRNALLFASKYSEKIDRLVIEDIGPEAQADATRYYEDMLGAIPTPFPSKLAAKQFFMNDFGKVAKLRGDLETIGLYLYSNLIDRPDGTADWRFSKNAIFESIKMGRAKDHWRELRALSVPTLVIRGGNSPDLSSEVFSQIAVANPRIQTYEVPNAGHWVHYDQPEVFIRILKQFADGRPFDRS